MSGKRIEFRDSVFIQTIDFIKVSRQFNKEDFALFNKWCWDNWILYMVLIVQDMDTYTIYIYRDDRPWNYKETLFDFIMLFRYDSKSIIFKRKY